MTPTILLLLTVTVAMDLASVSKQAKMVEMLRNRPPPEPLTLEARRQAADLKSVSLTGDCAAQFNTVSRKSLARSIAVTCAKIEKRALSNVDLAKATNPIPAYMRFCRSAQLANNFASHVQDVIDAVSVSETESIDAIVRTIHLLINHGNYGAARNYIGAGLRKLYTDLTMGEERCVELRHQSQVMSMMESFLADTIKLVGELRFGAVFDLIIKKDNFSILKSSSKGDLTLGEKINRSTKNGCFGVYQSKMKQAIRVVPMHGYNDDCDLEAVYQTLAHDAVPNANFVLFSTTADLAAVGYQHALAGLAQHLNIVVDLFYTKDLKSDAMDVIINMVNYGGGLVAHLDTFDHQIADYIEQKLDLGRVQTFHAEPVKGEKMLRLRYDSKATRPILEVSCKKGLNSIVNTNGDDLLSGDYLLFTNGELAVIMLDNDKDLIVDCTGKYEATVSISSDLTASMMLMRHKTKPNKLGRLSLSSNKKIDAMKLYTDSGDTVGLESIQTSPQIYDFGFRQQKPETGPAWASIVMGDLIRLKRTSVPLFSLQDEINGLVLGPGEQLSIAFLALNDGAAYDLSVGGSNPEWTVTVTPSRTDADQLETMVQVIVSVPMSARGIQTCMVTLAGSNKGRTVSSFAMTLVSDQLPDIEPELIDHNVKIINRFAETTVVGHFENPGQIRREAIFSAMIPPSGYVTELRIIYNNEIFSSKIKVPQASPSANFTLPDEESISHDVTFDADDVGLYARTFSLHEIMSGSGQRLSLVKLRHDKNRLMVKTVVEPENDIKFEIVIEQLLERTRFKYTHTLAIAQQAQKYTYHLTLEDRQPLKLFNYGTATNAFFAQTATKLGEAGESTGLIYHEWSDRDNLSDGYDPFAKLFSIEFDFVHSDELACDFNWAGEQMDFVSRCRIKDVFVRRPMHAIFLMDTSGSMWGARMQQARDIFHYMIEQLSPQDKFNVMRFSDDEELMEDGLLMANNANKDAALEFLGQESTGGGTNIYTALVKALITLIENSSGFAIPTLYLLTDGEATSGVTDPDVILNTVNYVTASRKIHINTIALGSEVTSSLVNRLARLGDGQHIHINEQAELFSVADYYQSATKNALSKANWGVTDIQVRLTNGVDPVTLSRTEFSNLVPGNEIVITGRLATDNPETLIKSELRYLALGSEEMSFTKYFNQAASFTGDGRFGNTYSSRSRVNLEMSQMLEAWKELNDEEQPELEQLIATLSTDEHLLTPFVTLQVSKPALRDAIKSPLSTTSLESQVTTLEGALSKFGYRKRRSDTGTEATLSVKHHFRPQKQLKHKNAYAPLSCGTSELISLPSHLVRAYEGDEDYLCFSSAEIAHDQIMIQSSANITILATFKFGQLTQLDIGSDEEGIRVKVADANSDLAQILKFEGDDETTLEFGSQKIGHLSASRFANFTYAYYDDIMVGVKIDQLGFSFEIGQRDEEHGHQPQLTQGDVTCFGRSLSLSRCSSHDLTASRAANVRGQRTQTPTLVALSTFAESLR